VRAAFVSLGLHLPGKRITINLAPADLPKEGAHYDLPIALGLLAAIGAIPLDSIAGFAAIGRGGVGRGIGTQVLDRPIAGQMKAAENPLDMRDVRGQETAKRALEVAAAGGHNLLMVGPPGSGKSMLAARLSGLLPPLTANELLDVSMVHSVAGLLHKGELSRTRPFRSPHHSASMAAMVGGGSKAKPGEASLAHRGVLFLDELPEFTPQVLDSLRQPLETGEISVARANAHVSYPARFQLIAAMNPCRCGSGGGDGVACRRGVRCAADYQARVSGPFMDRIDIQIDVPAVTPADLALPPSSEGTAEIAARVAMARARQMERNEGAVNATLGQALLEKFSEPDHEGRQLLIKAAETLGLTARGYHRVLRVARTLADLDGSEAVHRLHIAEALSHRRARSAPNKTQSYNQSQVNSARNPFYS